MSVLHRERIVSSISDGLWLTLMAPTPNLRQHPRIRPMVGPRGKRDREPPVDDIGRFWLFACRRFPVQPKEFAVGRNKFPVLFLREFSCKLLINSVFTA